MFLRWTLITATLIIYTGCASNSTSGHVKGRYAISEFKAQENLPEGKGIVQGFVRNIDTGKYSAGCSVYYIKGSEKVGVITDMQGFFKFILPAGRYRFYARCVGDTVMTKSIQLKANKIIEIVFYPGYYWII